MALPQRFCNATFDSYEARTPSQAEALRTARRFVRRARKTPTWAHRLKQLLGGTPKPEPRGLYLVGPAGTGKTHLLAAMYRALTPEVSCAFLHSSTLFRQTEPPEVFASRLSREHAVCCLDEVEIDDPANEMRLIQVMQTLADKGVHLFATSNIEPEAAVSNHFRESRFERFLDSEFRAQYHVLPVRGPDHRRTGQEQHPGHGWIGPPSQTRAEMYGIYREQNGRSRWWTFDDLRTATTNTAHTRLIDDLTSLDHLFLEDVTISDTDDALRLLRVIDALYLDAAAPSLYFTAERPPGAWFDAEAHTGLARAVAEKFDRTVSRVHALCDVQFVGGKGQRSRSESQATNQRNNQWTDPRN